MEKNTKNTNGSIFISRLTDSTAITCEKEDEEYHPYEHRDLTNSNSTIGTLVHLLKSSLGTGILSMPMAFQNSGLLVGIIGTIIITFLCAHCIHIFVQTSREVSKRKRVPSLGFVETVEYAFEIGPPGVRKYGPFMRAASNYGVLAACCGSCCLYIVFIGQSFQSVINHELNVNWDVRYYILATIVPCIIIAEIRNLKYLVPVSAISNVCIITTFAITLWYIFDGPLDISERPLTLGLAGMPMFFSTVIFAVCGITVIMPIENAMRQPQHFSGSFGVLNIALTIVVLMYGSLGFFGYVRYGDEVKSSITLNLPKEFFIARATQALIGIAIVFAFGLQSYVPIDTFWRKIKTRIPKHKRNVYQITFRAACVLIMGAVAVAVPNIDPFLGLIGAICYSFVGLFVPALIETISCYPDNLGFAKWIMIKNVILMVVSVIALVAGSSVSIQKIIKLYA